MLGHGDNADRDRLLEMLAADNAALAAENAALARDLEEALARLAESEALAAHWKAQRDRLVEQVKLANARFFGSRSERALPEQVSLFNDAEAAAAPAGEPPAPEPRPRRRGGPRRLDLSALETVVVEHVPGEGACPLCGSPLEPFNVEVRRVVRMVPAHLVVEEHRVHVHRCPACCAANAGGGEGKAYFSRAAMPALPLPGSFAGPSLIAWVLHQKYCLSLPLARIESALAAEGLPVSRQAMSGWVLLSWERWLSRLLPPMRERLLAGDVVHADETEVQVLREPGRDPCSKSRMWLFAAPACDVPVFIYEYNESRSGDVAAAFLDGWSGHLVTDGYPPYFSLGGGIVNVACLAHVRRKFAEIVKAAGGDARAAEAGSVALEARRMVDAVFHADAGLAGLEPGERRERRMGEVAPLMDAFSEWVGTQLPLAAPGMALRRALEYAATYMPYVRNALDDGRIALDNNLAERAIRPFVVGRKNWLFSDTPRGAAASAGIYSVVTTARANGLNARAYLEWLLEEMPNTRRLDDPDVLSSFLPWSPSVPDRCRVTPAEAARAAEVACEPVLDVDPAPFDEV